MPRKSAYLYAVVFSLLCSAACFAQEQNPHIYRTRYLFAINPVVSGKPFAGVTDIFIDNKNHELYALDSGNNRVVITDLKGGFLYEFSLAEAGAGPMPKGIAVAEDGLIYIAEDTRIAIVNYNGRYIRDMDLSGIPGRDAFVIQSFAVDGDKVYIGGKGGIVVMDRNKETFLARFEKDMPRNLYLAVGDNEIYVREPAVIAIFRISKEGKPLGAFGKVSSLAGGFSMISDMAIDRKNGRVIVTDSNRAAAILFDRNGNFLVELGGSKVLRRPTVVAADDKGRVYVGDGTQKIRVFEVTEEAPVEEAKPETPKGGQSAAENVPAPESDEEKDEVAKAVEKEKMLLPVFFGFNLAEFDEANKLIMGKDIEWLKKNPAVKIKIQGYMDKAGKDEYRFELWEKRTKAVTEYLTKQGISPQRFFTAPAARITLQENKEEGLKMFGRIDFFVAE